MLLFVMLLSIIALLSALPLLLYPTSAGDGSGGTLFVNLLFFIVQYVLPMGLMSYLYGCSWHRIRKENRTSIRITGTHMGATYISGSTPKPTRKHNTGEGVNKNHNTEGVHKKDSIDEEEVSGRVIIYQISGKIMVRYPLIFLRDKDKRFVRDGEQAEYIRVLETQPVIVWILRHEKFDFLSKIETGVQTELLTS